MLPLLVCLNQRWILEASIMTHDELLARIKDVHEYEYGAGLIASMLAVVELHKPMLWKNLGNDTDGYKCQACQGWTRDLYPCPTIQAIEKELG